MTIDIEGSSSRTSDELYEAVIHQGDVDLLYSLGLLYCQGDDVARDYKKAAILFELAAFQGHSDSQCKLGLLYSIKAPDYWKGIVRCLLGLIVMRHSTPG